MQHCPNCGAPAADRFCAHCGQRNSDRLVSVGTLVRDVLEDQLSLEARLPRTLVALLGRPGKLTAEYAAGRVARYVAPFRLYFVAGLVFFFIVSFVVSFDTLWGSVADFADEETGAAAAGSEIVIISIPIDTLRVPWLLQPVASRYVRREAALNALPPREAMRVVYGGTLSNVSAIVLLLVPGFALLLKALFPRRLYIEHLIFILHLHAALFLMAVPVLFVLRAWLTMAFLLWAAGYIFLALRRVYGESIPRTLAKWAVLLISYNVALVAVLITVMFLAVISY